MRERIGIDGFQRFIHSRTFVASMIFCSAVLISCSNYSFTGSGIPGINSIAIPIFDDKSAEFQIQETLTNSIVERFLKDNTLKVRDLDEADSVLRGTITRIEDRPIALGENERAQEFEFYIYVTVSYEGKGRTKPFFTENLRGRGTYENPEDREEGINEAINKLSTDILNQVITGW